MAAYAVNAWTHGTLKTLLAVEKVNQTGKRMQISDLENGTLKNWAYVLSKNDYMTKEGGLELTPKGKSLLSELTQNPPKERKRKAKIDLPLIHFSAKGAVNVDKCTLELHFPEGTNFKDFIDADLAKDVITLVLKKKSGGKR
jgi:hypothetical protein